MDSCQNNQMPVPNENDEEQKTVNLRIDFINSRNSSIKSKSSILASSKKSTSRKSKSKSTSRQSSSVTSKGSLRSARCSTNNNSEDSGSFSEQEEEESSSGSYYTDSEESDSSDYLQYFVEVDENVNPKIKEIYNNLEADIDKYQVNDFCTRCGMKFSHSDARPGKCVLCY